MTSRLLISVIYYVTIMQLLIQQKKKIWLLGKIGSYQLNEASVNEAKATPATIGTKEETTQREGLCLWRITKKSDDWKTYEAKKTIMSWISCIIPPQVRRQKGQQWRMVPLLWWYEWMKQQLFQDWYLLEDCQLCDPKLAEE